MTESADWCTEWIECSVYAATPIVVVANYINYVIWIKKRTHELHACGRTVCSLCDDICIYSLKNIMLLMGDLWMNTDGAGIKGIVSLLMISRSRHIFHTTLSTHWLNELEGVSHHSPCVTRFGFVYLEFCGLLAWFHFNFMLVMI